MTLQRYDTGETNEQIEDDFTDQSGQDTIAKEYVEEPTGEIVETDESADESMRNSKKEVQKGYIFTFKKQSHCLLNVPKEKHTLSDLKEKCEFPEQFTSENID